MCHTLNNWNEEDEFEEEDFLELCMFKGKELHWQTRITRLDSVSKPFLSNALRFAENAKLTPKNNKLNYKGLENWMAQLDELTERLAYLKEIETDPSVKVLEQMAASKIIVPVSEENKVRKKDKAEEGPHITAYFDMDRTLINDFSAKKFMTTRLFSGRTTIKEYLTQFMTALVFSNPLHRISCIQVTSDT